MLRIRSAIPVHRLLTRALGAAALAAVLAQGGCGEGRTQQVWFAPNLASRTWSGCSGNRRPGARHAAASTSFQFYEQQLLSVLPADCPSCGPNILPAFEQAGAFGQLDDWGVAIAVEVGVIKGHTCSPEANAAFAVEAIRNVAAAWRRRALPGDGRAAARGRGVRDRPRPGSEERRHVLAAGARRLPGRGHRRRRALSAVRRRNPHRLDGRPAERGVHARLRPSRRRPPRARRASPPTCRRTSGS